MQVPLPQAGQTVPRSAADVRAMAVAIQANLVQLKVAESKRQGSSSTAHDVAVRPPGVVRRFRETLIDRGLVAEYSDQALHLRLHEVWGQYCLMGWLFSVASGKRPAGFSTLADDAQMHCETALAVKHAEVHACLWRMRFEQVGRQDGLSIDSARSHTERELIERIPARAFGKAIAECTDDELLLAGCEHAGMLAVVRWVMDRDRAWGEPGIMDVGEQPFQP